MAKVPKLVSGGGKAPAKFSEFTKRKTRRRVPFISVSDVVFPDIVFAYNPIKNFTNSKVGPDPVWSYTAPNYNDDGSYTGSTPWWNTELARWEWGGPSYTQYVQNSKFDGAGVGVSPSGWDIATATSNGITRSIVGVGPGYIDVRFSGTCVGATAYPGVSMSSSVYPAAVLSDTWTGYAKTTLLTGDWSALNPRLELQEATSANGYLASSSVSLGGKSGQIVSHTRTLTNASTVKCTLFPFMSAITVGTTVDFTVRIEQPQLTKTATAMPYIATGVGETITCNSVPQPRIDAGKGLWGGPAVTNLFSGDSSQARSVTLTAQAYTLFVWSGSASCSYGTATPGSPLKFTATAGTTVFAPTGVSKWLLVAGTFGSMPYVPPGTTQPSAAATTGGNGVNIPLDAAMLECFQGKTDGVELCTNGTFDSDAGWGKDAGWSIAGGKGVATNSTGMIYQTPAVTIGTRAICSVYIESITGQVRLQFGGQLGVTPITAPGYYTEEIIANTTNGGSGVRCVGAVSCVIDNISIQRLQPAVCTVMHEAYMGVGGADLANNTALAMLSAVNRVYELMYYHKDSSGGSHIIKSYDLTTVAQVDDAGFSANEIHRRYVQTSSNGAKFRVGYQRFNANMTEITAGIQWSHTGAESTWAVFDGSFNPLVWLRFGLSLTVPVWMRSCWISNKSLSPEEINIRNIRIAN